MQVGGNKQMNDFLSNHGVSKSASIKKKYNSSAAALYREVINAKIEGREPPTSLPEDYDSAEDVPEEEEDPIQRELRLRAEAKERLAKKFGAGGLKSQAVGSSPIPPGGYGNQPSPTPSAGDDIAKALSQFGQGVMKTLQDAKIGETIESGVNSVREKLNDPNFQKDVKEKAQAGWSWLSSTAGSIWSAAKEAANQIATELNEGGTTPQPSGRTPRENGGIPQGGDRSPVRSSAGSSAAGLRSVGSEEIAIAMPKAGAAAASGGGAGAVVAQESEEERTDDDDWMEQELKKARENLHIKEKEKVITPVSPATGGLKLTHEDTSGKSSSGSRRHHSHHRSHRKPVEVTKKDLDNWLDDDDDDDDDDGDDKPVVKEPVKKSVKEPEKKVAMTADDFFAEFGV